MWRINSQKKEGKKKNAGSGNTSAEKEDYRKKDDRG